MVIHYNWIILLIKNPGKYLDEFVVILSKSNAHYLENHYAAITNKLDAVDKYGEGQLASFIMTLSSP